MTGVNPFNFASWNLGGLNWNAWGEPNEVGLDDAPRATTTPPPPPPAQATDTVTIGSNPAARLDIYQPPGISTPRISGNSDEAALVFSLLEHFGNPDVLEIQDWTFLWLTNEDIFPEGRSASQTEEEALATDYEAWNKSIGKQIGIDWPNYQKAIESARYEIQNTPSQAEQSGGSYSFSFEPSYLNSNWSRHGGVAPTISSAEAERLERVINENQSRFISRQALIEALAAGGFYRTDSVTGGSLGQNQNGAEQILVKLQRTWVDLQISSQRSANGGGNGYQNIQYRPQSPGDTSFSPPDGLGGLTKALALLGFRPPNQDSAENLNKIAKMISELPTDDKAYTMVGDAGQDTVKMLRVGGPISIEFFTDALDISTTTGSLESITGPEYQLKDGRQVPMGRNAPLPSLPKSYGGRTGAAAPIPSVAGAVKLQFYDERGKDLGTQIVQSGGIMVATQFGVFGNFSPKTKRIEPPPGAVATRITIFDASASLQNVSGLGAKVTTK
jgi:hypothetical protein